MRGAGALSYNGTVDEEPVPPIPLPKDPLGRWLNEDPAEDEAEEDPEEDPED
jgi:hypothetical protein